MNKSFDIPILFLVFNRPDTTRAVFKMIKNVKPKRLYIASDGPRHDRVGEDEIVKKIRDLILSEIDWNVEIKTLFREKNFGCGQSVFLAIDWFFQNEEMGIILEDDCLPNMSFFEFCETTLVRYKDDNRISAITGDNLSVKSVKDGSYFFSRYCFMWGWATWRRTWIFHKEVLKNFDTIIKPLESLSIEHKNANTFIIKNAFKAYSGKIDTWDYQWILSNYLYHGLIITPKFNLVKNIGFNSDATHTTAKINNLIVESSEIEFPLKHPSIIIPNLEYDNFLYNEVFNWGTFSYYYLTLRSLPKRMINILKSYFNQ